MIKETKRIFFKNVEKIIMFEIIFKILIALIFIPFFLNAFKFIMNLNENTFIPLQNITNFITNPITIFLIILFLFIMGFYLLFDIGTIIILLDASKRNKDIDLKDAISLSFKKSLSIFKLKNFGLLFYVLFLIPFLKFGTGFSLISIIIIPEIIIDYFCNNLMISLLYLIILAILWYMVSKWIYSIHYFFLEDKSFREAIKSSTKLINKNMLNDTLKILIIQIFLFIFITVFIFIGIGFILLIDKLFNFIIGNGSFFTSMFVPLFSISIILFSIFGTKYMYLYISLLFYHHKVENNESIIHINVNRINRSFYQQKLKFIKYGLVILIIVSLSIFIDGIINNKYNYNILIKKTEITAHRGASAKYPENTMSAFIAAREMGADWIELDVRQTKDKKIIVIHDTNLKRITGVNLKSWKANYDEIKDLDAGSYKGKEFKGEQIPVLEDVIKWAKKYNMKLNIEIKPSGHDKEFENQIIDIINSFNYKHNCVLASKDYDILKNIKKIDKNITTVYVINEKIDDINKYDKVDYFSIEETNITSDIVDKIHQKGKKIYGWTVNTEGSINRMIELNVDNIITDDIELSKSIVLKSKNTNLVIEMIDFIGDLLFRKNNNMSKS